jgi:hypothetical protein
MSGLGLDDAVLARDELAGGVDSPKLQIVLRTTA